MKKFFFALLVFTFFKPLFTQAALKTEPEIEPFLKTFMNMLETGRFKEAAPALINHWAPSTPAERQEKQKSIVDAGIFNASKLGKIIKAEKISHCKVGSFLHRSQWVLKYEQGFVHWNFIFYSSGGEWALNSYRFGTDGFTPLTSACN